MKEGKRRTFRLSGKMSPWKKALAKSMAKNKNMSWGERILWKRLRDKQLGVRWYKQKPFLGYILDFWCPRAALCVEVDGPHHAKRRKYDAERDVALLNKGVLTMRFTDEEVKNNVAAVVALIYDKARRRIKS